MQIHGPSDIVDEIDVRINPGSKGPFAVVEFGAGAVLYLESVADADELIRAAAKAKALLIGETVPVSACPGTFRGYVPAFGWGDLDCGLAPGHDGPHGFADVTTEAAGTDAS